MYKCNDRIEVRALKLYRIKKKHLSAKQIDQLPYLSQVISAIEYKKQGTIKEVKGNDIIVTLTLPYDGTVDYKFSLDEIKAAPNHPLLRGTLGIKAPLVKGTNMNNKLLRLASSLDELGLHREAKLLQEAAATDKEQVDKWKQVTKFTIGSKAKINNSGIKWITEKVNSLAPKIKEVETKLHFLNEEKKKAEEKVNKTKKSAKEEAKKEVDALAKEIKKTINDKLHKRELKEYQNCKALEEILAIQNNFKIKGPSSIPHAGLMATEISPIKLNTENLEYYSKIINQVYISGGYLEVLEEKEDEAPRLKAPEVSKQDELFYQLEKSFSEFISEYNLGSSGPEEYLYTSHPNQRENDKALEIFREAIPELYLSNQIPFNLRTEGFREAWQQLSDLVKFPRPDLHPEIEFAKGDNVTIRSDAMHFIKDKAALHSNKSLDQLEREYTKVEEELEEAHKIEIQKQLDGRTDFDEDKIEALDSKEKDIKEAINYKELSEREKETFTVKNTNLYGTVEIAPLNEPNKQLFLHKKFLAIKEPVGANMKKKLLKFANSLDKLGLYKVADLVDEVTEQMDENKSNWAYDEYRPLQGVTYYGKDESGIHTFLKGVDTPHLETEYVLQINEQGELVKFTYHYSDTYAMHQWGDIDLLESHVDVDYWENNLIPQGVNAVAEAFRDFDHIKQES